MYIGDYMARGATYFPERLALVDVARGDAGRFRYRDLNDRANRLAHRLRGLQVGPGDRVALLAHNGVEYLDAFFACGKLGAVLVPCNWRLHPQELAALCRDVTPRVLLHDAEFAEAARAAAVPLLPLGAAYEAALQEAPADPVGFEALREEHDACLLFTGGTTGASRGARVSHRMIAWNTLTTLIHELNRDDVTLTHTPLFHTGGLLVYTVPLLLCGGTVVLMRRWDPELCLTLIARERVTALFCVPTQYQQLLASPALPGADLRSLRFLTSGGAPLPVPLLRAFQALHPVPFKQGFGMTEFGPGVFSMGAEYAERKAGSIGKPNYFVEARVADAQGRPVARGEIGELWLKGPAAFSGYFPGGAAEAFDAEGFFHTGDLCRVDEDGFYYIVDRKKDMFISGGENVYPAEIEKALYEHPAVARCAVIGVADARWGQVGRAFVVLADGAQATEEELLAHLRGRLARYKVPRSVLFRDALPLSPAGKILKRELA